MNPTFKAKPIPYSKLINNQLVAQNTSFDCAIPDEHLNLQLKYISKSSNNTIFQARDKDSQTNKNKDKS